MSSYYNNLEKRAKKGSRYTKNENSLFSNITKKHLDMYAQLLDSRDKEIVRLSRHIVELESIIKRITKKQDG